MGYKTWVNLLTIMVIVHKLLTFIIFSLFVFLLMDKVVSPWAVKFFDVPILHPTDDAGLDKLMNARINM